MDLSGLRKVLSRIAEIEERFTVRGNGSAPRVSADVPESPSRESFEDLIEQYAQKYDMDPQLVKKL
ncbi:MAG: hypothetical protein ACPL7L_03830, partial [bacterium]